MTNKDQSRYPYDISEDGTLTTEKQNVEVVDVDKLANFIRITNGENKMGAGQLAEKICEYLTLSRPKQEPQNVDDWIKAEAAKDYEGLLVQFRAMKCLLNSQGERLSWYANRDYSLSERRLNELTSSLESEREMNAELTAEVERLSHLKQEPQPVDNWEFFTDGAYWDMCAVRPIGDKSFNSPNLFHVSNLKEGERLASLLNIHCTYSPPIGIEAITDIAWDVFFNSDKPAPYNQMKDVILYLAAIGRLKV